MHTESRTQMGQNSQENFAIQIRNDPKTCTEKHVNLVNFYK